MLFLKFGVMFPLYFFRLVLGLHLQLQHLARGAGWLWRLGHCAKMYQLVYNSKCLWWLYCVNILVLLLFILLGEIQQFISLWADQKLLIYMKTVFFILFCIKYCYYCMGFDSSTSSFRQSNPLGIRGNSVKREGNVGMKFLHWKLYLKSTLKSWETVYCFHGPEKSLCQG